MRMSTAMHQASRIVSILILALGIASVAAAQTEGIKVHGAWTIVVRNADGTVASRHEFENSLVPLGQDTLAKLLTRTNSVGTWAISLDSSLPSRRLCNSGGQIACFISEPSNSGGHFRNLTISLSGSEVILTGSAKAAFAGDVSSVETALLTCPLQSPGCVGGPGAAGGEFTQKVLAPPIGNIVAGQTIDVTVRLSFSSSVAPSS